MNKLIENARVRYRGRAEAIDETAYLLTTLRVQDLHSTISTDLENESRISEREIRLLEVSLCVSMPVPLSFRK